VRGFDVTCSAPKSVSVLFAIGDDRVRKEVLEALPPTGPMAPPTYVVHLDGTGITVTHPSR